MYNKENPRIPDAFKSPTINSAAWSLEFVESVRRIFADSRPNIAEKFVQRSLSNPVLRTGIHPAATISLLQLVCHQQALDAGWYEDPNTGERVDKNFGEQIALVHSELSEALEGERKGLKDDHLPHRDSCEVELADAIIRILDLAGSRGMDISGAIIEKLEYNLDRSDHKKENRAKSGGKKF